MRPQEYSKFRRTRALCYRTETLPIRWSIMSRSMLRSAATSLAMMFVLSAAPALAGPFDLDSRCRRRRSADRTASCPAQTDGTHRRPRRPRAAPGGGRTASSPARCQELQNQLRRAQGSTSTAIARTPSSGSRRSKAARDRRRGREEAVEAAPPPPQQQQAGLGVPPQTLGTIPVNPGPRRRSMMAASPGPTTSR